METEHAPRSRAVLHDYRADSARFPYLNWSAIFGGALVAMAVHLFLGTLGAGVGLASFAPVTDAHPAENFSAGAAVIWGICSLVAIWCGSVMAGRYSHSLHGGFVHGILVWSITLVVTIGFASGGTGTLLGGALKVFGQGAAVATQTAATAAADMAKDSTKRSGTQTTSFIDEAVPAAPANNPQANAKAKREIGFAVTRLFAPGNDVNSPENRAAAVQALVTYGGKSEAEAKKTVDDWTTSYLNLQAELNTMKARADEKARVAADEAAGHLSAVSLWAFVGLLLGLLVSAAGGAVGARSALRHHAGVTLTRTSPDSY